MRGNSAMASVTILIQRPNWSREMKVRTWSKGKDLALVLVTDPAKDKGIVYLKRSKEVWNWIPAIERTIKLPPSMMSQSWMGTDFTNDDLVKEASLEEDYLPRLAGDTTISGMPAWKLTLIPKPESAVIWGKILILVDKQEFMMLYSEYYDEENVLVNILRASDISRLGGRLLPARLEMVPAAKPNNKTILTYTSLEFDKPLDDDFFTTRNMPRLK